MLDDAAQRIYPGGFRPAWASLNFAGNSDTLVVNFRNTRRIFQAARAVRGEVVVSRDANDDGSVDAVRFESDEGDRPVNLKDLRDGPLEDGVRIGTFDRAKGM